MEDVAGLLAGLPDWAFAFGLVLCRVSAAVMTLPGLGETEPPAVVRAGIALAIAVLLLPAVRPLVPAPPPDAWRWGAMVLAELFDGALLGWLARIVALALPMAGQVVSMMLGLASVLQPDSLFGAQGTPLSRLFGLAATVLVLASGLYALPLQALAGSYLVVPPGQAWPAADGAQAAAAAVAECFALALRLAAPFVIAGVVWQVALGLLARLVPTLQIYAVVQPAQIAGGLLLLAALGTSVLAAWGEQARDAFATLPGG